MKWVNIALGFVSGEMKEAFEVFKEINRCENGKGMVWEIVERASFVSLGCYEKIFVMQAARRRHLYRLKVALEIREADKHKGRKRGKTTHSKNWNEEDRNPRWIGEDQAELIDHVRSFLPPIIDYIEREDLSRLILTRMEFELDDLKSPDGMAGLFGLMYEDHSGTRGARRGKYPLSNHKQIFLGKLREISEGLRAHAAQVEEHEDEESNDGGSLLEEVVESGSGPYGEFSRSKDDAEDENESTTESEIIEEVAGRKRGKQNVTQNKTKNKTLNKKATAARQKRRARDAMDETDLAPAHGKKPRVIGTRNLIPPKVALPAIEDEPDASASIPGTPPPAANPERELTQEGENIVEEGEIIDDVAEGIVNPTPTLPPAVEEIVASGYCGPPLPSNRNGQRANPSVNHQNLPLLSAPGTRPANVVQPRNDSQGNMNEANINARTGGSNRGLLDIEVTDDDDDCNTPTNENGSDERITTVHGDIFAEHRIGIENLINDSNGSVVATRIPRLDDIIESADICHEIIPPALPHNSFARKVGLKLVKDLQHILHTYANEEIRKIFNNYSFGPLDFNPSMSNFAKVSYFREKRREIEWKGFTLLKGLLIPGRNGSRMDIDALFAYVDENFLQYPVERNRAAERRREMDSTKLWVPIFNRGTPEQENDLEPDQRRFQTWPWKMKNGLPQRIAKKKAAVDIQLGNVIRELFGDDSGGDSRVHNFSFPEYGSIFLRTCRNTSRQQAHCDFPPVEPEGATPFHDPAPIHDLFIMYSGKQPFAIRVYGTSHIDMNVDTTDPSVLLPIARNLRSKLEIVPPYSVLIGRGDLIHGGASGREIEKAFTTYKGTSKEDKMTGEDRFIRCGDHEYNTRGHLYATRGNYTFDGVFRTPDEFPTRILDDHM